MTLKQLDFDRELIQRCQTNAPRYTSYPTADRFSLDFTTEQQLVQLKQTFSAELQPAISLYIHIPFCNTLCLFCGCNKIITNNRNKITEYLEYLAAEFALYAELLPLRLPVVQLHFGGGSPSWLSIAEVEQVMNLVRRYFDLSNAREIAMELDPRHVTNEFMVALRGQGFNRVSLGVQDFAPEVQKAVNRIQPLSDTQRVLDAATALGFKSTNIDLIYGLPLQTLAGFSKTINIVIQQLKPARIALFNYAHLPQVFMPQTRINEADLPSATEKLNILQMCVERLAATGYIFIGMDHFALPDDELALALADNSLQRNFQGYSTFNDTQMLAFGVSSIGFVGQSYYQNAKDLASYYAFIRRGELPILRGMLLTTDDVIRRAVIQQIMCQFSLNFAQISTKFKLEFSDYFAAELAKLPELAELGLIRLSSSELEVTNKGRFLIRNVAMVFDSYLQASLNKISRGLEKSRYSQVI